MALMGVAAGGLDGGGGDEATVGMIFGVGAIICFPVMYGAMGFIFGAIGAFIYNLVAQMIGGVEIELGD
jgi:hypothetical protein